MFLIDATDTEKNFDTFDEVKEWLRSQMAENDGLKESDNIHELLGAFLFELHDLDLDDRRIFTLSQHLGCDVDELSAASYGDGVIEYGKQSYLVVTDEEADEAAERYIADSLWAFNAEFIVDQAGITDGSTDCGDVVGSLRKAQEELCESANPLIRAIVGPDLDAFVSAAISADGRGHFLSFYDGEEHEMNGLYIYRQN